MGKRNINKVANAVHLKYVTKLTNAVSEQLTLATVCAGIYINCI